ncbi:MAG: hypothetical protein RRC34_06360 [Lentisphaeria bacterium]|nr:hypothetical protein [Lentisphaeria bacterium]
MRLLRVCLFSPLLLGAVEIGMIQTARIDIPGPRLELVPLDEHAPLVARLDAVVKTGTGHLYEVAFVGLEPGDYDLTTYFQTAAGEAPATVPYVVTVERKLPPDFRGEITVIPRRVGFPPAWYGMTAVTLSVLWALCLPALIFFGRGKQVVEPVCPTVSLSLRDRLRACLSEVGETDSKEVWQRLEATLIRYLAESRQVTEEKAFAELTALKKDDVAGPVILEFERCLHAPGGRGRTSVARALAACARVLEVDA